MVTKTKTTKTFFAVIAAILIAVFAVSPLLGCNLFNNNHDDNGEKDPPDPLPTYTVTFDVNGGSEVKAQQIDEGGYAARPKNPKKQGYTFVAWYKDSNLTVLWDFSTEQITEDVTIYAKWKQSETPVDPEDPDDPDDPDDTVYTVTFNSNGGSTVKAQDIESGAYVARPVDPTRDGYIFDAWYLDSGLTKLWNFSSDAVTKDITLYAGWIVIPPDPTYYTVTFNSNGGSAVKAQSVLDGTYATKPANPTRDGYTFDGWYTDGGLTKLWNFASDAVTKNVTLYAGWTAITTPIEPTDGKVTATFNVGYEARIAGASNPAAQRVESGSKLTAPTVTLSGCSITGWYVENGNKKWDFATDKLTADTTLFARWQGTIPGVGSGSGGGGGSSDVEADDYTPTMNESGKLYIHYLRSDGNYNGWHIWAWWDGGDNWFEKKAEDKSGAIYEISLSAINATTSAKFIVARGDWAEKDGGDNTLSLSGAQKVEDSYHWYVQSGKVASGTPYLAKQSAEQSDGKVDRSFAQNLNVMNTAENTDDMGVGYQIFVASFCDSDGDGMGDIQGVIKRLDYLESLNVDILWLTPIQSSDSYHGYDCFDYYAIDPKFGTNADYRELTYKAHQRGMKIVMDLVVNHTSPKNEWFLKSKNGVKETVTYQDGTTKLVDYTNYYRWSDTKKSDRWYDGGNGKYFYSSFGSGMPELNYDYQVARDAMADVAMYWMAYGLDGFRMDAIKHMFMWDESDHDGDVEGRPQEASSGYNFNLTKDVEWFKEFNYRLKSKYPYAFTLGENLTGDISAVAPFYAGMDSLFDFNTYYDLPTNIAAGDASKTANALNSNANAYAAARNGAGRAINSMITSNHDVERLAWRVGQDTSRQKLYFAVTMTMPGLTWIYYGDEIGMYSESKGDDRLYRQPMKWTAGWEDKAVPKAYDFPLKNYDNALASAAEQATDGSSLLYYVKSLTKLRNDHPVLIHGNATCSTQDGMLKIVVTDGDETVTVFHNFSGSSKTASASGNVVFGSANVPAYGTVAFSSNS